jgi:hypothetical protein
LWAEAKIKIIVFMNVLLGSKADAEAHFGAKSVMAINLLGMNFQGEKAWKFTPNGMNEGYEATIGLFNEKVRYVAFKKMSSKPWDEGDVRSCLMHIAPYSAWSTKPGSDYFDYSEKEGEKVIAEVTGWYSAKYRHAIIYVPTLTGEVAILPDRSSLDPKI